MSVSFYKKKDPTVENRGKKSQPTWLVRVLMKLGIAKSEKSANIILVVLALAILAFSAYLFAIGQDKSVEPYSTEVGSEQ